MSPSDPPPDRRPVGPSAGTTRSGDPEADARAAERVVFFSDAVVAIAITLLALALPVPPSTRGTTNSQLLDALGNRLPEYSAFLISFVVIGNHWAAHRRMFRYVNRLNGQVTWLNMTWLLMMILTPFATRMLTGQGAFGVRFTIYALVQVIAAACLLQMDRELSRRDLLRRDAPESARHPDNVRGLAIIVFLISIPVAFAAGGWAFALWAAVPVLARALRRRQAARHG